MQHPNMYASIQICTRFIPWMSNGPTNHPHSSRAGSPPICVMTSHLAFAPAFMSLLIACVYSQTSWEMGVWVWGVCVQEQATGTQRARERDWWREWGRNKIKKPSFYFCVKVEDKLLQSNSADRPRQTNICFRAISANHLQSGSYLNIDERFPHLINSIKTAERTATDGKRG